MGKLFGGKERKAVETTSSAASLDDFLHNSADSLNVIHPPPPPPPSSLPKLSKLDTTISRYPQALAVNQLAQQTRPLAPGRVDSKSPRPSPRPNKKGLFVKFTDSYPEIIGEGGDESEYPVIEISKRRRTKQPPAPSPVPQPLGRPSPSPNRMPGALDGTVSITDDGFRPKPLARTQTGYSSVYEPGSDDEHEPVPELPKPSQSRSDQQILVPGKSASARYLETSGRHDENRRSFIEVHQAEMRQAEAQAFAKASRASSAVSQTDREDGRPPMLDEIDISPDSAILQLPSPDIQIMRPPAEYSPAASISTNSSIYPPSNLTPLNDISRKFSVRSQIDISPAPSPSPLVMRATSVRMQEALAAGDDSLSLFVARTKHLFEIYRLHAESVRPLSSCSQMQCARAGLWWFLRGRMGLEIAVRDRPTSPQSQMKNDIDRQQAYSNLSKGYWLCEEIIPEIRKSQGLAPDAEIENVSQQLITALTKLAMSMKRNGFLPPEDAFLPQTIDKSIWLEYPPLSQDMVALLSGNGGSGIAAVQHPLSHMQLLDALPPGDTPEKFSYGRVPADVFLMEQGRENHRLFFPCMLSTVRPQSQSGLIFVLASQDGSMQLAIQDNKKVGPVWEDVRWRNETCTLDIRLPRGFILVVQLTQNDYRMLWNMYDFGAKLRATLHPRGDEQAVFRTTLRSFQYLDADPQSRTFPKEPVSQCDVALFESLYKESGPSGPRSWHCGFRIAVVTGTRIRTASGVNHTSPPTLPIQFGFFRGDGDAPALSVKLENGRQKGRMVMVFNEEKERSRFHSLLTGTALDHGERVFSDVPIKNFTMSQSIREPSGMPPFSRMPWTSARVLNEEFSPDGEAPTTVLADKLRVVVEYQNGSITDRINVAPGELRMRLEVSNAKLLRLLRQPQQDMTIAVSEAQVSKEVPKNMIDSLQLIKANQTIRTLEFNNLRDLHDFQAAVTGYEVIFDALALTFAISRRRMVVPIHKKWEAGYTRIQIVRQEDKQLQLLAFFEDFHYGHCMNFVLKGTDVYESFQRSSKYGIKFIDAKFPLPRRPADKDGDFDDMAFVCLDLPDLPGEHDDISIVFEKEEGESQEIYVYILLNGL